MTTSPSFMYKLILTQSERGELYQSASDIAKLLDQCEMEIPFRIDRPEHTDIMFLVPEHIAWEIVGTSWPGFSGPLQDKLNSFLGTIICI
jgi:hypothetical protein